MVCERCLGDFTGLQCLCGWKPQAALAVVDDPMRNWKTFECQAPNCHTVIRERIEANGSPFCRFCRARGVRLEVKTIRQRSRDLQYIALDEFGPDLYECIKLYSQRRLCRQQYAKTKKPALKAQDKALTKEIERLMPKLSDEDAARLYREYEQEA